MSRIDRVFASARAEKRRVLVVYLCIGDPSLASSLVLAKAALAAGADILELGVPFSDPTADGPAIARASERAIAAGSSFSRALETAAEIRKGSDAPLVLFGYYNPILVYGEERAVHAAAKAGVDALLVVDLPPEEGKALRDAADAADIAVIPLLTPTSGDARVQAAAARAKGFLYYVSVTGVTGQAADQALIDAAHASQTLSRKTKLPVVVGFGIDSPAKARLAAGQGTETGIGADGIVVGTAVVKAIETAENEAGAVRAVTRLVSALRAALDER